MDLKREHGAELSLLVRGCPRNCKRRAAAHDVTDAFAETASFGKTGGLQKTREPGDLP
jgi:hypothetical protein